MGAPPPKKVPLRLRGGGGVLKRNVFSGGWQKVVVNRRAFSTLKGEGPGVHDSAGMKRLGGSWRFQERDFKQRGRKMI